jgi:hypothetical protein
MAINLSAMGYNVSATGLSTGSQNLQSAPAQAQTSVQNAAQRINMDTSGLSKYVIELREIVDRLIGSDPPENTKGSAPVAVPNGDIQALHSEIDGYEMTMLALATQINRLRSI